METISLKHSYLYMKMEYKNKVFFYYKIIFKLTVFWNYCIWFYCQIFGAEEIVTQDRIPRT